jgi:multisubunit Na+/H+ antiporter MnhF subunit
MVSRMCSSLVAVRVTVAYAVTLLLVATILLVLGPRVQDRVVSHLSTNLHNLAHGHLGTLLGSAFVTADGQVYGLLPGLVCLLALAELLWRSGRLVLAFGLGHIGATPAGVVGGVLAVGRGGGNRCGAPAHSRWRMGGS